MLRELYLHAGENDQAEWQRRVSSIPFSASHDARESLVRRMAIPRRRRRLKLSDLIGDYPWECSCLAVGPFMAIDAMISQSMWYYYWLVLMVWAAEDIARGMEE